MSLQQTNINKLPKHLQHVRIQKEEEEEQWISGEELCTEGSSDEENTNDIKRKFKNKTVHQPSKESLKIKKSTLSTSNISSGKESDEEISNSTEKLQLSPTEWRPKRGSIKLPNIDEIPLDIEQEKFNMEYEYHEAFKKMKSYKNSLTTTTINEIENNETDDNDFSTADLIIFLDNESQKLDKILKDCKYDRLKYQQDVCEKIKHLSNTSIELQNTKSFHHIFKYKSDSHIVKPEKKDKKKPKIKSQWKRKKVTITSPKIKDMTEVVFTETEKERLSQLLSDIDIEETEKNNKYNVKQSIKTDDNINIKPIKYENSITESFCICQNGYRKTEEELRNLEKIEKDLKTLQEICDDADLKGKVSQECSIVDVEDREWKAYLKLTQSRFKRIDEKINKLRKDDEQPTTENTRKPKIIH